MWSILFSKSSQTIGDVAAEATGSDDTSLYSAKALLSQTHLVVKLIYLLFHNHTFRSKLFLQYIERQDVGYWQSTIASLFQRKMEREEQVASGQLLTFCTWLVKTLRSNICFKYSDFTVLTFVNKNISHCLMRILAIILRDHISHLRHDVDHVQGFWTQLLETMMLTWRAMTDDAIPYTHANENGLHMLAMLRQYSCIFIQLLACFMQDEHFLAQREYTSTLHKTLLEHEELFETILTTIGDARKAIAASEELQPEVEKFAEVDEELLENLRCVVQYTKTVTK